MQSAEVSLKSEFKAFFNPETSCRKTVAPPFLFSNPTLFYLAFFVLRQAAPHFLFSNHSFILHFMDASRGPLAPRDEVHCGDASRGPWGQNKNPKIWDLGRL